MEIENTADLQQIFTASLILRLVTLPIGPVGQLIFGVIIIGMGLTFFVQAVKLERWTEVKFIIMSIVELLILLFTGYAVYWGLSVSLFS